MNRFFHIAGIVWFATSFLIEWAGWNHVLTALLGAVLVSVVILSEKPPLWMYAAAAAFCACACFRVVYDQARLAPMQVYEGHTVELCALVTGRESFRNSRRWTLRVLADRSPKAMVGEQIRVTGFTLLDVELGDVVKCTVELDSLDADRSTLYASGIRFTGRFLDEVSVTGRNDCDLTVRFARLRERLSSSLHRILPNGEGSMLSGILFGVRSGVPPAVRQQYARAGAAHLLSVSGLHLSIFNGILTVLLRGLPVSRRRCSLAQMAGTVGFMGLTGFSPSVSRAGLIMLVWRSASLLGRDSDALNSLGFALVVLLICNPYAAHSLSLQLSYLSVMGICAFSQPFERWMVRRLGIRHGKLPGMVSVTLCAGVLTQPLLCWEFGEIPLVSPVVNLILLPVFPLLLGCGLAAALLGCFPSLSIAARVCGLTAGILMRQTNQAVAWWAALPFASVSVRERYVILWMGISVAMLALLWAFRVPKPKIRYALVLLVLCLLVGKVSSQAVWGGRMRIAAAENGTTLAFAYGRQGAVIGAPVSDEDVQNLTDFFRFCGVKRVALLVAESEAALDENAVQILAEQFPLEAAFSLERCYGFEAELFGRVWFYADRQSAQHITVDIDGLRLVKTFGQEPAAAHLLVNGRNEWVFAPGYETPVDDRYFSSKVISLRLAAEPTALEQACSDSKRL